MDAALVPLLAHFAHSGYPPTTTQARKTKACTLVPIDPSNQAAPRLARIDHNHHQRRDLLPEYTEEYVYNKECYSQHKNIYDTQMLKPQIL
jgi:hypothetical protein